MFYGYKNILVENKTWDKFENKNSNRKLMYSKPVPKNKHVTIFVKLNMTEVRVRLLICEIVKICDCFNCEISDFQFKLCQNEFNFVSD